MTCREVGDGNWKVAYRTIDESYTASLADLVTANERLLNLVTLYQGRVRSRCFVGDNLRERWKTSRILPDHVLTHCTVQKMQSVANEIHFL